MQDKLIPHTTSLDLPQADLENLTPLQFAAKYGVISFIEERLSSIDPSQLPEILEKQTAQGGFTALHYATFFGHRDCVEALLKYGASVHKLTGLQQLPIHLALISPKNDKETKLALFTLLNTDPINLSQPNRLGDTVAHLAAESNLPEILAAIKTMNERVLSAKNRQGMTPLLVSLLNQSTNAMSVLMDDSPALQEKDSKERNALHYAALYGNKHCVEALLPYFDKNSRDHDGKKASDYAAQRNDLAMLAILGDGMLPSITGPSSHN